MSPDTGREALPIPDQRKSDPPLYQVGEDDLPYEPIEPLHPPEGAPNVLVVLLDDERLLDRPVRQIPRGTHHPVDPPHPRLHENLDQLLRHGDYPGPFPGGGEGKQRGARSTSRGGCAYAADRSTRMTGPAR